MEGKLQIWAYIGVAVLVAVLANSISAVWASKEDRFNIWLIAILIISPIVFITFGLVTSKVGLAVSSGTIDSLLTVSTVVVGLFIFHEWDKVSIQQYTGIGFALAGIILMQFHK